MTSSKNSHRRATILAGIADTNNTLYWRVGFSAGDPMAIVELPEDKGGQSILILRDIEMKRARQSARVDRVACPAEFEPETGLSGDRETATAQAAAECLSRAGVRSVIADRTLPLIFAEMIHKAGIAVECDTDMYVRERRSKSDDEIEHLLHAQQTTHGAVEMACRLIASAQADADGTLLHKGEPLTAERVRLAIDLYFLERNFTNPPSIIACGSAGADCHNGGSGPLRTGSPVIVDIFPRSRETRYCGDCTRTVVHGDISDEILAMHATVRAAKAAATAKVSAGVTGEAIHRETLRVIQDAGYEVGLHGEEDPLSRCSMPHGTGHGIGLDVHEPPLLDFKGPKLIAGDAVTIEPGLYRRDMGGVRVEDIVVVTDDGCLLLGDLDEGLVWA